MGAKWVSKWQVIEGRIEQEERVRLIMFRLKTREPKQRRRRVRVPTVVS